MTTASARTIVCVVCDQAFTYPYTGGRDRRTCDQPECKTARKTTNKRSERDRQRPRNGPDGSEYVPADYPHNIPGRPGLDDGEWADVIERNRWYRERHRLRAQPEGVTVDQRSIPLSGADGSVRELLSSGHGYVMDDHRDRDEDPLRLIPTQYRGAVKHWFKLHGEPLAGLAGSRPRPGDPVMHIVGRPDTGPSSPPLRITRRFCARNALVPLERFSLTL
ncbi:hypothetical protein [Pseudonocardia hydrocarbonoxydans]|uniref:Uncharacterized protein n=1 Tax=Pseudonocardia hydrocarbonoxydans TaxID=76726 RepID=A0A4Y3WU97_9PSEU|nr:hypothetical protein [Pseudonocardia hydrocarbonoxydans]GEC21861.1 hypothetical protein PHY01_41440 [Pseudonocardia hydrocarbonoxydans]